MAVALSKPQSFLYRLSLRRLKPPFVPRPSGGNHPPVAEIPPVLWMPDDPVDLLPVARRLRDELSLRRCPIQGSQEHRWSPDEEVVMSDETEKRRKVQGEGDKAAARDYNEATRQFVESGRVEDAAGRAGDQDAKEAERAEEAGLERAKEKDPAVHRDYHKPADD
jgi:hypothetical protein